MSQTNMLCLRDYETFACEHMPRYAWDFFSLGAERNTTLKDNIEAFTRYRFVPRMLRNVSSRDLSVTILGEKINIPIGLAPAAFQKLAHPDGEIAAAKAAASMGTVYTLSTLSNTSLEEMNDTLPNSLRWMQVYVMKDRNITVKMIQKAERCGFKALVLTVDTPKNGLRLPLTKFTKMSHPPHLSVPNIPQSSERSLELLNVSSFMSEIITWDDVRWLRSISELPIVLKGILTAEDARLAMEYGASAVWVSNHGGRQLDGTMATIDALEDVANALKGTTCEVYMDGGVRWGSDVLKALGLGARAVFIGRPLLWGLAHSGETGVQKILEILKDELDLAMTLAGCKDISEAGPWLLKKSYQSKM